MRNAKCKDLGNKGCARANTGGETGDSPVIISRIRNERRTMRRERYDSA